MDGEELYSIVERYAAFGDHHTGTPVDEATTDWVVGLLAEAGYEVERPRYGFDRYTAAVDLVAGGEPIPARPLFYSGCGRWDTDEVTVVELDGELAARADLIDDSIRAAAGAGDGPIVVAVPGPDDQVVNVNRRPEVTLDRPVVVIPANRAGAVAAGARLRLTAAVEPGTSANVVARIGSAGPGVIVTTPLTGWTPCAGERGTGLAVALAMAADLAGDHRVELVGCSGHELDFLGLRRHLETADVVGRPVIHLGASVAAVEWSTDGTAELGAQRLTITTAPDRAGIAARADAGRWRLADLGPDDWWPGEGGTWKEAGAEVLSFVGKFSLFHTDADRPSAATTPEALATATAAAIQTARHFLTTVPNG